VARSTPPSTRRRQRRRDQVDEEANVEDVEHKDEEGKGKD
jgi:hypothetical protein